MFIFNYLPHFPLHEEKISWKTYHVCVWDRAKTGHIDVSEDFSNTVWCEKKRLNIDIILWEPEAREGVKNMARWERFVIIGNSAVCFQHSKPTNIAIWLNYSLGSYSPKC